MCVDCNRRSQQASSSSQLTKQITWLTLTHKAGTYHILTDNLSKIGVSSMTICDDTPAQKHIVVCRLDCEVDRLDRVSDVHEEVHLEQRREEVLM